MDETQLKSVEDQERHISSGIEESGKGIKNLGKVIQDCKKSSDDQFALMKEQFAALLAILSKKTVHTAEIPTSGFSGSNSHPWEKRYELHPSKFFEADFPMFRGENPDAWLRNCERCFQFHLIKYEEWVNLAEMYLEDRARIWYTSWKLDKRFITWTIFCNELCKRFSDQKNNEVVEEASQVEQPQVPFVKSACKAINELSQSLENVRVSGRYSTEGEIIALILINEELNDKSELKLQEETTSNQDLGRASNVGTQMMDEATKSSPSKLQVVKAAHKMLDKMTDSSLTEEKDKANSCDPVLLGYELFNNEEGQHHLVKMRNIKRELKDSSVCWSDDLRYEASAKSKWGFGPLTNYSMFSTQAVSREEIVVGVSSIYLSSISKLEFDPQVFDPGIDSSSAQGSVIQMNANEQRMNHLSSLLFSLDSRLRFTSWGGHEEEADSPYVEKDGDLITKYFKSFECTKYFGCHTTECSTDTSFSATYVSNEGFLMRAVAVVRPLIIEALGTYVDGIDYQASGNEYCLIVFNHFRIFDNDSHAIFDLGGHSLFQIGYMNPSGLTVNIEVTV